MVFSQGMWAKSLDKIERLSPQKRGQLGSMVYIDFNSHRKGNSKLYSFLSNG